jgi:hypothetical protein
MYFLNRFLPSWSVIVFVLVTLIILFSGHSTLEDGDTYMHIGVGNWILSHGTVPKVDVFSYTKAGQPWAAHEWLAEVMMALVYRYASWTGLVLMAGVSAGLTLILMLNFLLKRMTPLYALVLLALAYFAMETHLSARPHVLAWPLMVFWMRGLLDAVEQRRLPHWSLIPVMVLWANLHGGFILGFAVAVPVVYEAIFAAQPAAQLGLLLRWFRFLAIAALACCIHPAGWGAFTFLHHLMGNDYLTHIDEWHSTNLDHFGSLSLWIYVLLGFGLSGMLRLPVIRLLFVLGLLYQAIAHVRYLSIFGMLVPLILALPFEESYQKWRRVKDQNVKPDAMNANALDFIFERLAQPAGYVPWIGAWIIIFFVSLICINRNLNEPASDVVPRVAVDKILSTNSTGHIFNEDYMGGYLIMRGIPVYTDGRADLYGADFMRSLAELLGATDVNFIATRLNETNVGTLLMSNSSNLIQRVAKLPGWQKIYEDRFVCVYLRDMLGSQ